MPSRVIGLVALALLASCDASQPEVNDEEPTDEPDSAMVEGMVEGIVAPRVAAHCLAVYEVRGEPGSCPSGPEPMREGALSGAAGRCAYDAAENRWSFLPEARGFEGRLEPPFGLVEAGTWIQDERGVLEHGLFTSWNADGTKRSELPHRDGELSTPRVGR